MQRISFFCNTHFCPNTLTPCWPAYSSIVRYHKDIDAVVIQLLNTSSANSSITFDIVYSRIVKILRRQ
ncbi:MAG: hypothetical protein ACJA0N_000950 [Pseudohongiellaceae bacterium]|jgi:hypothetical protein